MIWHVVRFDFTGVDDTDRAELESALAALDAIEEVAWIRVARDIEDPQVTGLLTVFADQGALETYRTHPEHLRVVERIRALGVGTVRLDVETHDPIDSLP